MQGDIPPPEPPEPDARMCSTWWFHAHADTGVNTKFMIINRVLCYSYHENKKNVVFWPFYQISVFLSFLAFLNNLWLRKTNRRLRTMTKTLFLAILSNFGVFIIFSIFKSLAASDHEQVASYHEKNVVFGHFIKFRCFYHFQHF